MYQITPENKNQSRNLFIRLLYQTGDPGGGNNLQISATSQQAPANHQAHRPTLRSVSTSTGNCSSNMRLSIGYKVTGTWSSEGILDLKRLQVVIDIGIQVQPALLDQLHDGNPGKQL